MRIGIIMAIITLLSGILVMMIAYSLNNQIANYKATINEYEFILSECWAENESVKNQLGVFYMPRKEKKGERLPKSR